jgi:hypothetical protein
LSAWDKLKMPKVSDQSRVHDYLCKMEIGVSPNLKVVLMIKSKQLKWSNYTFNRVLSI